MKKFLIGLLLLVAVDARALVINPTWEASITSNANSAQIQSAINNAIIYLEAQYHNPVTINIQFGWGTIMSTKTVSSLGQSMTYLSIGNSNASIKNYLTKVATSADDAASISHFPSALTSMAISMAQEKVFGILAPTAPGIDGYVGFGSGYSYDFTNSGGGGYDLYGVALHEITEVMGRMRGGSTGNYQFIFDAFNCNWVGGAWDLGRGGIFSVDGCATPLQTFNPNSGGDIGDWGSDLPNDPVDAYGSPNTKDIFSNGDLVAMDVLGYDRTGTPPLQIGQCGTANNVAVTIAPTTNLCAVGTPSAVVGSGPWTWSCIGTSGTVNCQAPVRAPVVLPNAPTDLRATAMLKKHGNHFSYFVRLAWTESNATGYKIYRSSPGKVFSLLGSLSTTSGAITFNDVSVIHGATYSYYVVVTNSAGSSVPSTTVTVTP